MSKVLYAAAPNVEDGMAHGAEIELVGIKKQYGDVVAVQDSSFEIGEGEFFSLLGPSGCGKTTTLRMISGLEEPTAGQIFLVGNDVTYTPPHRRNVNTVFQDYALFPHMNIWKNVYFPLKMKGVSVADAKPRVEEMLRLVEMDGYGERLPQQLSGGQRQRIALARSLVGRPRALLLDEPLGALDFKLRTSMQTVLKDIQKSVNIAFIYVTHDQTEAITMSDRICVMNKGLIHQIGSPTEIYNNPETYFVAGFIGEMNFMNGEVVGTEDGIVLVNAGGAALKIKTNKTFQVGEKVYIGVRPEKIFTEKESESANMITGSVARIIFKGSNFDISLNTPTSLIQYSIPVRNYRQMSEGESVSLYFNPEDAVIFKDEDQ
jgi:spermidine/putrescine ABC transporter ATP-binding subunit